MGEGGLEPPRSYDHWHLKPARLPFRHSPEQRSDRVPSTSVRAQPPTAPPQGVLPRFLRRAHQAAGFIRNSLDTPADTLTSPVGLQSLENGLGRIVDGVLNRAFKNNVRPIEIGRRLIREIDIQRTVNAQGQRIVPNNFVVSLSSPDFEALRPYIDPLIGELVSAAEQYCADEGYTLTSGVSVDIVEDAQAPRRKVSITSDVTATPGKPTRKASAPASPPTLVQTAIDSPPALPTAVLAISDGREVVLGEAPVVIGRLSECDITIEDPNISRRHATVTILDGSFRITDLGSTNGTKVNGDRISSQFELSHGDEITVGLFSIRFEIR